jgi:HAE1 family hydrophobic/amphiphilic exporter-1
MAATLTLVAIFAPVIFMQGIIGRFFEAFAIVVTFGVLASLFVSMTLTPMLCSRFLKVEKKHGKLYNLIDHGFHTMDKAYASLLNTAT